MARKNKWWVQTLRELVTEARGKCVYCEREFGMMVSLRTGGEKNNPRVLYASLDHFIPISMGGTDDRENLAAACHLCNGWKGDRLFVDREEAKVYLLKRWKKLERPDFRERLLD